MEEMSTTASIIPLFSIINHNKEHKCEQNHKQFE